MKVRQFSLPDKMFAAELLKKLVESEPVVAPRSVDKPLVLYGAGDMGRMASRYFDHIGISFDAAVDGRADERNREGFWLKREERVLRPEEVSGLLKGDALLAVCIATTPYSGIENSLTEQGWKDVVPFYDICEAYKGRHPLGNGWFSGALSQRDADEMAKLFSIWADARSCAHFLQFAAWHTLREEWLFDDAPVTIDDRYFIPEVTCCLHDHEVFADIGSYHGMVTRRFIDLMQDEYDHIYMVEADPDSGKQSALVANSDVRIELILSAVGSTDESGCFHSGLGYTSQLSKTGRQSVDICKIDQLGMKDVSYLKLHLEGGELSALQGALGVITKSRPIIAATAYHDRKGLWELPKWFADNLTNYRLLFRLHSWCGTGAVIYALPVERMETAQ